MAKILIIDDDIDTTNLLGSMVKAKNHEAISINNSMDAVDVASSTKPDLILLDIMMPGINGIQLCKMFQSIPELSRIPVIMVSALHDIGSKKDSFNAGAKDFLTKPLRSSELIEKIDGLI
jgi:two-component system alkaline phosphatase synthesis response regulator PhoP